MRLQWTLKFAHWHNYISLLPHPKGDVCNSRLVNHIFSTEPIDVIFHLAAKTHVGEWQLFTVRFCGLWVLDLWHQKHFSLSRSESSFESPSSFQHVNIHGTRVLLGAAYQAQHQPQRFIYVSTDEVYGSSMDQVTEEGFGWRNVWAYSNT